MKHAVTLIVGWMVAILSLVPLAAHAADGPETRNKPLLALSGANSKVREANYRRVTSADQWQRVWLDHLGLKEDTIYRQTLEVDFDRCMVLAVFQGTVVNIASLRVDAVVETDQTIVVRLDEVGYQTGEVGFGNDKGHEATPYAFVVLPKSEKQIILENNVQEYKGHPPVWKELTRLGPSGR